MNKMARQMGQKRQVLSPINTSTMHQSQEINFTEGPPLNRIEVEVEQKKYKPRTNYLQ
jgi:hypothetical protein